MGKRLKSVCLFWETYWPNASREGLGKEKFTTSFFSLPSYRQNLLPVSLDKENTSLWIRRTASAVLFWGFLIFYGCKQNPQRLSSWLCCLLLCPGDANYLRTIFLLVKILWDPEPGCVQAFSGDSWRIWAPGNDIRSFLGDTSEL